MMKINGGVIVAVAMALSAVPFVSSYAHGHDKHDKSDREACIATLQPPVQKGQTLTAEQEEEVRKCLENKHMKKEKPAPANPNTKPDNTSKPSAPDQTKPNPY